MAGREKKLEPIIIEKSNPYSFGSNKVNREIFNIHNRTIPKLVNMWTTSKTELV